MARSHHRKKHKTHVRQFRQSHDTSVSPTKGKGRATSVFTISGAVLGFAIGYFATPGSMLWLVIGLLAGGAAGYLIGKRVESQNEE
ncbi:MAG: hypothetical protein FJY20_04075 [Bacteroidetes bacterium]|nr:hypothetical protein [Bacteroidota bacterium]